jgi:alkyl hydroperoxide reductase subunit AhpF
MPCDAIVYLPAQTIQLDTTAIFGDNKITALVVAMLNATLRTTLNINFDAFLDYGTNLTAELTQGTVRIWRNGKVVIRLYDYIRDPASVNAAIWAAITATLSSLNQIMISQAIGAIAQVTDTQYVGNNLILTVNI